MAKRILEDELWEIVEPLLPRPSARQREYPGRKSMKNRAALTGIFLVLRTGIPWEDLPLNMGCGSRVTCWRHLRDWQEAGVRDWFQRARLQKFEDGMEIDWSHALFDPYSIRAVGARSKTGPNPTDRTRPGNKRHVVTDGQGIPLAAIVTGTNEHNVSQLLPLIDWIPSLRQCDGGRGRRPAVVFADRAYDSSDHRRQLELRGIESLIARRGVGHGKNSVDSAGSSRELIHAFTRSAAFASDSNDSRRCTWPTSPSAAP